MAWARSVLGLRGVPAIRVVRGSGGCPQGLAPDVVPGSRLGPQRVSEANGASVPSRSPSGVPRRSPVPSGSRSPSTVPNRSPALGPEHGPQLGVPPIRSRSRVPGPRSSTGTEADETWLFRCTRLPTSGPKRIAADRGPGSNVSGTGPRACRGDRIAGPPYGTERELLGTVGAAGPSALRRPLGGGVTGHPGCGQPPAFRRVRDPAEGRSARCCFRDGGLGGSVSWDGPQ